MAYVIKEWFVDEVPNTDGEYVRIKGREGGLISFVLSLVGIDPTVSIVVDKENIRFEEGSWSGFFRWITPLRNVCSSGYGYSKPWKPALVMALIGFPLIGFLGLGLLLIGGAIAYYFLNKQLGIEFSDMGGKPRGIQFKRSVIEGIKVDEQEAARVIRILEFLTQGKAPEPAPSASSQRPVVLARTAPDSVDPERREANATSAPALFCPECGVKNTGGSAVCGSCGASLL